MEALIIFCGVFGGVFIACMVICVFSNRLDVRGMFALFAAASVCGLVWNLQLPPMEARIVKTEPKLEKPYHVPVSRPNRAEALVRADRFREILEDELDARSVTKREYADRAGSEPVGDSGGL